MRDAYSEMSFFERMSATMPLSDRQAAVIRQTYVMFSLAVFAALAGGYVGATSETMARFFSGWLGWIIAIVALNAVPYIAMACRHNPLLGTGALVFDGFFSGLCLSPLLWVAAHVNPLLIYSALGITG